MLNLNKISKAFNNNRVLNEINLHVSEGEVVSLIGPSGTGKTTLLRMINFLERADEGEITIDNFTVNTQAPTSKEILAIRRKTAMVFQNYSLFNNKTVLGNVTEGLKIVQNKSDEEAEAIAKEEIERVGMLDKLNHYPAQLSGGQQQRVGIARAMALKPKVLLLDEPTSSLDPERSIEILKLLQKVADTGVTMIVTTHEMDFAKYVSDRVVFLEGGGIVEEGPPEQIFNAPHDQRTEKFVRNFEVPFANVNNKNKEGV